MRSNLTYILVNLCACETDSLIIHEIMSVKESVYVIQFPLICMNFNFSFLVLYKISNYVISKLLNKQAIYTFASVLYQIYN